MFLYCGTTANLADGEALGEAFALCIPDEGWEEPDTTGFEGSFPAFLITELNSCYALVYPVTLQDFDGITYTANNEAELIDLLATEEFLEFVLPISLEGEDGIVTANDAEELFDILLDCQEQPWEGGEGEDGDYDCPLDIGGIACYDLNFPATFLTADGGEETINDYEELSTAMLNGTLVNFVYPVSLTNVETGEEVTVNSEEEFSEALEDCYDGDIDSGGDVDPPFGDGNAFFFFLASNDFDGDCYSIIYPVTVTTENGEATYNSIDDLNAVLETGDNFPVDIVFPVNVTNNEGEDVTLESLEAYAALLEECQ